MDSNFAKQSERRGLHVAIIMDGNGRWAEMRGLPRAAGHAAGAAVVETIVRAANERGIERLTLFALSSDNWSRPPQEIAAILELMRGWLEARTSHCVGEGVRVQFIGRRDRMPDGLRAAVEHAERATAACTRLVLRLAVDYSSRDAIVSAARSLASGANVESDRVAFERVLALGDHSHSSACDVDLLIRSGGEQRLSDFLLWECAWAELVFSPCMWPDFDVAELARALAEFERRERRFGRIATKDVG